MSFASVRSCTLSGVNAQEVTVEVHITGGLPGIAIVGLPQSAVRESKDRVKAAITHAGLTYPQVKIIVNLAPADLPKQGGRYDLPIAIGILIATQQLPARCTDEMVIVGELGLCGDVRSVSGVLPATIDLANKNTAMLIPLANKAEALLNPSIDCVGVDTLNEAVDVLQTRTKLMAGSGFRVASSSTRSTVKLAQTAVDLNTVYPCMSDVQGQQQARRALEIAAAGSHNLLMTGPPGTGKSMLASRMPGIQPPMTEGEAMETASVLSITHTGFDARLWAMRPYRSPHHTASGVALVGGGSVPMPGEASLAHNGVLFLDEIPEFSRTVLDVLREPMETGTITISRASRQADFPARFQLIGARNPCPCGYDGDADFNCRCTPDQILRYQQRLSGPFLDRIDLHVAMTRIDSKLLLDQVSSEPSVDIRQRVIAARQIQLDRQGAQNATLTGRELKRHCKLGDDEKALLKQAMDSAHMSVRASYRMVKVARTIADLEGVDEIGEEALVEALGYRG
ncbi:MAG: YifB family Mg chelatase-like AAA ATPase [Granulosicoccaceae bacterium]